MADWKPMDTAPRNGTPILVYINERGIKGVYMVEWDDGSDIELYDESEDGGFEPAWRITGADDHFDSPECWQPIPSMPK